MKLLYDKTMNKSRNAKIVFLDADGTLFHHNGYVPKTAIVACHLAQQNGHKICLCTGRQRKELYGDLLRIDYDGLITGSGAYMEAQGIILKEAGFSQEELDQLDTYTTNYQIPAIFESSLGLFGKALAKHKLDQLIKDFDLDTNDDTNSHGLLQVYRLFKLVDTIDESLKINKISFLESSISYGQINADLNNDFDLVPATFAPFGNESGEISSKHITKGTGIDTLLKHFQMDASQAIAIGDSFNDLSMFEKADYSIAMGNAPEGVKKKADWITTDLDNDGIFNAFKHCHLI